MHERYKEKKRPVLGKEERTRIYEGIFNTWGRNRVPRDKNRLCVLSFLLFNFSNIFCDYYSEEDLKNSAIHEKIENEADRFAGAFLLPKETYSKDVFSTSIDHFIQLKAKWKASIGCMIYRCDTLGILSPNQIKYLKDQMTTRVYWRKEPLKKQYVLWQSYML